jgi:tRNA pseudouridine13 synthase
MFTQLNGRDLDVAGDYRMLLCHPKDVDFEFMQYSDPFQPLIRTDLMLIQRIDVASTPNTVGDVRPMLRAMRVGFTLPPSSYATIALRELIKLPTSSDFQSEMNVGCAMD